MQQSAFVAAPYNGIGQAAPQIRLQEQAETLLDMLVDLPDGLRKRPPLTFLGTVLTSNALATARIHKIKDPDDGSLKFLVLNREGASTVARLKSSSMGVVALTISGAAQTYLDAIATPLKANCRVGQAVDYSIIVNKQKVVTVDASLVATRPHEALVFVKSGAFGKKYQVLIQKSGGSLNTGICVTPDGTDASDSFFVATDHIAGAMLGTDTYTGANGATHTSIATALASDGFTVTIKGAVVYISHTTDFTISVQDDQGGSAIVAAKDTVNNFSDLPKDGVTDGFTVSVVPTRGDKKGAYYVKFNSSPARGTSPWQETTAPGSQKGIDTTTMPIGVLKDSGGNWQCQALPWKQRAVGDQTLAIDPLFVNDTIVDVGYAFGRLLIVSPEEAFLTAGDDPFRIYPATMTTQIDSDPISLSPPTGNAQFRGAATFSSDNFEAAFITGLQQQCALRSPGDGPVTPSAVKLARLSKFQLNETVANLRPIENNSKVYLPIPLGTNWTGIRELQVQGVTGETLGDDMTASVPRLLPQGFDVAATSDAGFSTIYGTSGDTGFYVHIFRYSQGKRVQNGFFPMALPSGWTLCDIHCEGTLFYFFLINAGQMHCFTWEATQRQVDTEGLSTILTCWDLRHTEAQVFSRVYNAGNDTTTVGMIVPIPVGVGYVSARANTVAQTYPEGYLAEVVSQADTTHLTVKGDWTGAQKFYVGADYNGYWKLSQIFVYSNGDGRVVHGTLTVGRITFDLDRANAANVHVTNAKRTTRNYDLKQITFGSPSLYTGDWTVPVKGEAPFALVEVFLGGHIAGTISGFEWEGDFVSKSRRMT